jgi:hypothetical protein
VLPGKTCVLSLQLRGDAATVSAAVDGEIAFSLTVQLQAAAGDG